MEKSIARVVSFLLHPLIITTLGMLIILNSGTSLSVMQPQVKRITLVVVALFTFTFPALLIIFLHLTRVISDIELKGRQERMLPLALTAVMYLFTFFILRGIPQLTVGHAVFFFCAPASLFLLLLINYVMKPSIHMLGMGMLTSVVLLLMVFYGAGIQFVFIMIILGSGLVGTARMILNIHTWQEILAGYATGFLVTFAIAILFSVCP
ncbi:MAG: hypothetical protein K9J30_13500 [Bacteroidales bacterium]|nr:hypothetical protein [Bacteroidales bacterium]